MKKLPKEKLREIMEGVFEDAKTNLRSLKYDITQNEFDERLYRLNLAQQQIRKLIDEKPKVTREFIESIHEVANRYGLKDVIEMIEDEAGVEVEK